MLHIFHDPLNIGPIVAADIAEGDRNPGPGIKPQHDPSACNFPSSIEKTSFNRVPAGQDDAGFDEASAQADVGQVSQARAGRHLRGAIRW